MLPRRRDFIEGTLHRLTESMEYADRAHEFGSFGGFLQRLDPRVKVIGLLSLIFAAAASQRVGVTAALFAVGLCLALASGMRVIGQIVKLWGGVLLFTGAVVLPAAILTPGQAVVYLPVVGWPITDHGLHSALGLFARAETSATLAALMVLTTPWAQLLKALRVLRVPVLFVVILGMTYRSIFVLLGIGQDFFTARRARRVGQLNGMQRRQMAVSSAAVLLSKSIQLSGEVYEAMQARGFRGEVYTLNEFRMKRLDWCMLAVFGSLAAAAFGFGSRL